MDVLLAGGWASIWGKVVLVDCVSVYGCGVECMEKVFYKYKMGKREKNYILIFNWSFSHSFAFIVLFFTLYLFLIQFYLLDGAWKVRLGERLVVVVVMWRGWFEWLYVEKLDKTLFRMRQGEEGDDDGAGKNGKSLLFFPSLLHSHSLSSTHTQHFHLIFLVRSQLKKKMWI